MKIAVCDDEKELCEYIQIKVQKAYPKAEFYSYGSGGEFLLSEEQIDILFLDIQMPGKNGMETARELRKKNKKTILIFVTAIEEYVFQAFDVGAFHYLVKPFSDEKFEAVLSRAAEEYEETVLRGEEPEQAYLMVKNGGVHTRIWLDDIIFAEVFNRKIIIHKRDGDLEYYGRMSELEKAAGQDFFRCHRGYLVHFKYVEKYDASTISLERGTALMARQNYPEFVKQYLRYNRQKGKK